MDFLKTLPVKLFALFLFVGLPLFFNPLMPDVNATTSVMACGFIVFCTSFFFAFGFSESHSISFAFLKHPLFFVFTLLTVFIGISAFNSINGGDALFEWMRIVLLLLLFLFLCLFVQVHGFAIVMFKCINVVVPVFFMIALYQLYSVIIPESKDPLLKSLTDYRFASAFGNKNNFSQCLLFSLPFVVLSIYSLKQYWKGVAVFNAVFSITLICCMQTLSVLVALALVVVFCGIAIIYSRHKKKKPIKRLVLFGALCTALCFVFLYAVNTTKNKSTVLKKAQLAFTYLVSKENTSSGENSNSIHERLLLWKNSFQMIKERPLTGVGFTNWKLLFPKYGYSGAPYLDTDTTKFIKAHNDYLELWSEAGILTVLAFVFLFFGGVYYSIKIILSANDNQQLAWGLALLFNSFAFAVVCLFDFPFSRNYQLVLLLATFSFVIKLSPSLKSRHYKPSLALIRIMCILFFVFACFTLNAAMSRMNAEMHFQSARYSQKKKDWSKMQRECNKINSFYFPVDYAATPISWYKGTALFMNGDIKAAINEFENAHQSAPYHVQVLNDLGTCYDKEGNTSTAINYYTQALAVNPRFPSGILNLTAALFNSGNTNAAYTTLRTYPARYSNAQSLNFKTVILGKIADSLLTSTSVIDSNKAIIVNEYKQPKMLLKIEAKADSLHISFADYFKTVISKK